MHKLNAITGVAAGALVGLAAVGYVTAVVNLGELIAAVLLAVVGVVVIIRSKY